MSAQNVGTPAPSQVDPLLDDLAEVLLEKVDVLLDRLTDRALQVPLAGSPAWRSDWLDRQTDDGRGRERRRIMTRIALAHRAGLASPDRDVALARSLGITASDLRLAGITYRSRPRTPIRSPRQLHDQLAFFEV